MKKILLIDGNNLIFRVFYGTSTTGMILKNSKGEATNIIYSLARIFEKITSEKKYDYLFVAFDKGKKTFRHKAFPEYKANRSKTPDELIEQLKPARELLNLFNIKWFETDEYEADDLIATVKALAKKNALTVEILSGDKDLLQLVDNFTKVLYPRRGVNDLTEINLENFFSIYHFYPNQVTDFKALAGDGSDNLPGVKGIGAKGAIKLLEEYTSLENIYQNIEALKGKQKENLILEKETAFTCKHLATLVSDIELPFSLQDLKVVSKDTEGLKTFYEKYEFKSLLDKKSETKLVSFVITELKKNDIVNIKDVNYFFLETKKSYIDGEILGGCIVTDKTYFFTKDTLLENESLKAFFESKNLKVVFDYKKHYILLKRLGICLNENIYDTLLATYIKTPEKANEDFKKIDQEFVDYDFLSDGEFFKQKEIDEKQFSHWICLKTNLLKTLFNSLLEEIPLENTLLVLETKLSKVLGDMELNGAFIDQELLKETKNKFLKELESLEKEIYKFAKEEFNINSPIQLADILFNKLKLKALKKTKTGFSTAVEVLEQLINEHEIINCILEYRQVKKLLSTYIESFKVLSKNGFIHPLYKQALTLTGRLSSIEPNIQNIPIRTERGKLIRALFKSRFKNGFILSCDYSQVELRVLAHLSGDERMIETFNKGSDFHKETAAIIYHVPLESVTDEMRRNAKTINFGIIYGMSDWGLMKASGLSLIKAQQFIEKYFLSFPKVKTYLDNQVLKATKKGYTETLLKRKRFIPELQSINKQYHEFGKRTAMNAPIQGSAADIIKMAMVSLSEKMKPYKSVLIAQVHDELIFDCPEDELFAVKELVKVQMEKAFNLQVKLKVNCAYGKTWRDC